MGAHWHPEASGSRETLAPPACKRDTCHETLLSPTFPGHNTLEALLLKVIVSPRCTPTTTGNAAQVRTLTLSRYGCVPMQSNVEQTVEAAETYAVFHLTLCGTLGWCTPSLVKCHVWGGIQGGRRWLCRMGAALHPGGKQIWEHAATQLAARFVSV
eukprot:1021033-Amphidinium_carterae.1